MPHNHGPGGRRPGSRGAHPRPLPHPIARLVVAAIMAVAAPASAAPVVVDSAENSASSRATLTVPGVTPGMGMNRYLVVGVNIADVDNSTVRSVSLESQPLALLGVATTGGGGGCRSELWGLASPASGGRAVTVTLSRTASLVVGVMALSGVDPVWPTGTFVQASGGSSPVNISVPGAASGYVLASACLGGSWPANIASAPAAQVTTGTSFWDSTQQNIVGIGSGRLSGFGGSHVSWTISSGGVPFTWAAAGIALNAVGTPPPPDAAPPDGSPPDAAAPDTTPIDAAVPPPDGPPVPDAPDVKAAPADSRDDGAPRDTADAARPADRAPAADATPGGPPTDVAGARQAVRLAVGCACRTTRHDDGSSASLGLLAASWLILRRCSRPAGAQRARRYQKASGKRSIPARS